MRGLKLTEEQRGELEECFQTTEDWRLGERCQAVLMAARGRSRRDIAADLMAGERTVSTWLALYRREGLQGLRITWPPGKERLIPDTLAEEVKGWVRAGPEACGVKRAGWTHQLLASHLQRTRGVAVSETCMRDFCHRHGIYPYRPTYRFLRGDVERQQAAQAELAQKNERPPRAASPCSSRTRGASPWCPPSPPPWG